MKKIPILILHGWNLTANKFLPLKTEFEKRGYKVFCPDLPGFGKSKVPQKPLMLSDYVDFVIKYLRDKKMDKVVLIGHSFGGRIGIKLAAERPHILHALILTGAPGINPVPRGKIIFFIYLAKIGKLLFSIPPISILEDMARKLLYRMARATDFYNTNKKMRETFKNIIREDLLPLMRRITSSTLLIWGKDDGIVPLCIACKMNTFIRNSKLVVIKDARHGVPWTHPKKFADEVAKIIKPYDF